MKTEKLKPYKRKDELRIKWSEEMHKHIDKIQKKLKKIYENRRTK